MDFSKYIEMKMKAANTYKSNWQARDASEVTLRNQARGNANNKRTHIGPEDSQIPCYTPNPLSSTNKPGNGFNTDYSMDIVGNRIAGGTHCLDPVWGKAGGVNLIGCDQVTTILTIPPQQTSNSVSCYESNPGVVSKGIADPTRGSPPYTGWRNHVPAGSNGFIPRQVYPYPSG
jgi:hypothetical protein